MFSVNFELNITFYKASKKIMEIRSGGGVFCLGNPGRRGGLVIQEIQVGGGLKNDPIRRGGVDFFWNNPI